MAGMKKGGPRSSANVPQRQKTAVQAQAEARVQAGKPVVGPVKKGFSSLPSHEAYVVDVPEVTDLTVTFQYNYFVQDEGTNETGAVPSRFLLRSGETFDSATVDLMRTRVPRQVNVSFTPVMPPGHKAPTEEQQKSQAAAAASLIADNIDKIVPEDRFTSQRFVSLAFQDALLDDRLFELVSGSYVQHELERQGDPDVNHRSAAARLHADLGGDVPMGFLEGVLGRPNMRGGRPGFFGTPLLARVPRPVVNASMQLNARLFHDVVARGLRDPDGHFAADLHGLYHSSRRVQQQARLRFNPRVSEADYRAYVPYVSVRFDGAAHMPVSRPAEVVGYLVDKTEVLPGGKTRRYDPIVIESAAVGRTVDLRIRYGASYAYTVRTIARFTVPAVDDETGQVALATVLVSSRPSNKAFVRCHEEQAPPPPADLGFTWDHDSERMAIHWAFPPNPQRDIKRFQVFRRSSVTEPYSMLKAYDFDDSTAPVPQREHPAPELVERLDGPRTRFIDEDFGRTSCFMYALGSVDAHGNVSAYSAQHEVWFDQFKNRLVTRLVSHLGAPRQYPNMYLEADTFVDTMRDSGRSRLRVYFTPECYGVRDAESRTVPMVTTTQDGGSYRLQFVNPDAAKMAVVELRLDDRRTRPDAGAGSQLGPQ